MVKVSASAGTRVTNRAFHTGLVSSESVSVLPNGSSAPSISTVANASMVSPNPPIPDRPRADRMSTTSTPLGAPSAAAAASKADMVCGVVAVEMGAGGV